MIMNKFISATKELHTFAVMNSDIKEIADFKCSGDAFPGIIPTSGWGFNWDNNPAWDSAIVTLPYFVWSYRGDTE